MPAAARPLESFWLEKPVTPQCAAIDGSAKPKPKQSGRKRSRTSTPSSRRNHSRPWRICRTSDSGDGRLTSAASQKLPAGAQRPAATQLLKVANSGAKYSRTSR